MYMFLGSPRGGDRHLVRVSDSGYFSIPRTQRTDLCSRYVIFIVYWSLLMLRLCGQLSKNAVHLNSHKDAVLCPRVLPSSFLQGSLTRLVSTRTQVRSLRSWNWETANVKVVNKTNTGVRFTKKCYFTFSFYFEIPWLIQCVSYLQFLYNSSWHLGYYLWVTFFFSVHKMLKLKRFKLLSDYTGHFNTETADMAFEWHCQC